MTRDLDKSKQSGRSSGVDAFLRKVASTPTIVPTGSKGRLVFAMDATASREPTWDHACHIQAEMFTEASGLGGLEIQLAFFRGFGEFRAVPWHSRSQDLVGEMTGVTCLGGHTQIEKVLKHAIAETKRKKINALVYVGDCMEERVDDLCQLAGELGMLGVPAFVFQEGREPVAMRAFEQIARLTNGAYCSFDANSAQTLRDLLKAVAAFAAGGRKALQDFSRKTGGDVKLIARQLR